MRRFLALGLAPLLILSLGAAETAAQETNPETVEVAAVEAVDAVNRVTPESRVNADYKDPGTAMLMSVLIPGGGQIWAGETRRGATILVTSLAAPVIGAVAFSSMCGVGGTCSAAPYMLGLLAGVGAWGYGVFDASSSAERVNLANGATQARVRVEPRVEDREGDVGVGLGVRVAF